MINHYAKTIDLFDSENDSAEFEPRFLGKYSDGKNSWNGPGDLYWTPEMARNLATAMEEAHEKWLAGKKEDVTVEISGAEAENCRAIIAHYATGTGSDRVNCNAVIKKLTKAFPDMDVLNIEEVSAKSS